MAHLRLPIVYGQEEGLVSGDGLWVLAGLATLVSLPSGAPLIYAAVVAITFLALAVRILWQPAPASDVQALCRDTGLLAAAAVATTSPHYHWYFAWLALPTVVASSRALLWLATAPLLLIEERVPGDRFFWTSLVYVPAILLLLTDFRPWRAIKFRRGAENGETPCHCDCPEGTAVQRSQLMHHLAIASRHASAAAYLSGLNVLV